MSAKSTPVHVSDKTATNVVERKKLDEAIVSVSVPRRVRLEKENVSGVVVCCLRYAHSVKGGSICVYVHGENPEKYKGQKITARGEVWKKKYADGTCDLYIDLYPIADKTATHRLCVTDCDKIPPRYKTFSVRYHKVPDPKAGLVILAPMG